MERAGNGVVYVETDCRRLENMKDLVILIFKLLPFLVNFISIFAGILLYFWLMLQRRKYEAIHEKEKEEREEGQLAAAEAAKAEVKEEI